MKNNMKLLLIAGVLIFIQTFGFSQSFDTGAYTQISWRTFSSDSVNKKETKYVILCDIAFGKADNGETIYFIFHSNEYGNAALGFEMTESQKSQIIQIKNAKDLQLIFFTRTGTNNDNYLFIVDKIIPMKEITGFSQNELPKTVSYDDCYNAVSSYLKNGKSGIDSVIADKVNKAKKDAILAEAIRSAEAEREAELQRERIAVETEARNAARDKMRLLSNATVFGGYKPCFGTANTLSLDNNKIAVFGDIADSYNNYSVSSGNNVVMREAEVHKIELVSDTAAKNILREIRRYDNIGSDLDSITCIFFLSRTNAKDKYKLDDYVPYSYIVPGASFAGQYNAEALDKWILENMDK